MAVQTVSQYLSQEVNKLDGREEERKREKESEKRDQTEV